MALAVCRAVYCCVCPEQGQGYLKNCSLVNTNTQFSEYCKPEVEFLREKDKGVQMEASACPG